MEKPSAAPYIGGVEPDALLKSLFDTSLALIAAVPKSGLLMLALGAMLLGWIGAVMIRRRVPLGGLVRGGSTLVLVGVLVVTVLQVARQDPRFDVAMSRVGLPEQVVEGGETRVPLAPDGHYWLRAQVNGTEANFMVDTGATLTAISSTTAREAGVDPVAGHPPIVLSTANGSVSAPIARIAELRFGNVAARGLDTVIAPNIGEMNVIGMNLLSRLASWRVENGELVLVPNNPQPEVTFAE